MLSKIKNKARFASILSHSQQKNKRSALGMSLSGGEGQPAARRRYTDRRVLRAHVPLLFPRPRERIQQLIAKPALFPAEISIW